MKAILNIFLIIIIFTLKASSNLRLTVDTNKFEEIRIDPRSAFEIVNKPEDIFKDVKFIPLKLPKNISIGNIDQLEVIDNHFIVLNKNYSVINGKMNSAIMIFSASGIFQSIISGFYTNYFSIDSLNKQIIARDLLKINKLRCFDYNGKYLETVDMPFSAEKFYIMPNGELALYQNYVYHKEKGDFLEGKLTEQSYNLIVMKNNKEWSKGYLKFDSAVLGKEPNLLTFPKHFYESESIFFSESYSNLIYKLNNNNLIPAYSFILPLINTLKPNILTLNAADRKLLFSQNKYMTYGITDFYKVGEFITFRLLYTGAGFETFFYNTSSGDLSALSQIIVGNTLDKHPFGSQIFCSDKLHFYSLTDITTLLSVGKDLPNNSALLNEYSSLKKEVNTPIIVKLKMR
jgi:hypothetical protein